MLAASVSRAACASTSLARALPTAACHFDLSTPHRSGLYSRFSVSRLAMLKLPPSSSPASVSGICRPSTCAPAPSTGLRMASASPDCARALRVRASAASIAGEAASASSINASSCGSPSVVHQWPSGHAASLTSTLPSAAPEQTMSRHRATVIAWSILRCLRMTTIRRRRPRSRQGAGGGSIETWLSPWTKRGCRARVPAARSGCCVRCRSCRPVRYRARASRTGRCRARWCGRNQ